MKKLTFDPVDHVYCYDGVQVPNVTSVLENVGIVDFSMVPHDTLEHAKKRGTAVHHATHLYDLENLNEDTLGEEVRPYLDAWKRFRIETGVVFIETEKVVFSEKYMYAGTLDRTAILFGGFGILDIKSGDSSGAAIQTAAYDLAYNEKRKSVDRARKRWTVSLNKNGKYKVAEHTSKTDKSVFLSALSVYNYKCRIRG
jgi:hypothetical protein